MSLNFMVSFGNSQGSIRNLSPRSMLGVKTLIQLFVSLYFVVLQFNSKKSHEILPRQTGI